MKSALKGISFCNASMESDDEEKISLTGYNVYGSAVTVAVPEIVLALQALNVEPQVASKACEIFHRSNADLRLKSIKGSRKTRRMFFCVLLAYKELNFPVDPSYAADIVGLARTDIERAMNECAHSEVVLMEPISMLAFYIHRLNALSSVVGICYDVNTMISEITKVINTCKETVGGKEWVDNTAGKIVAITSIYFYLNDIKCYDVNMAIFEEACYLSWACIRRYHEQIIKYYNSEQQVGTPERYLSLPFC